MKNQCPHCHSDFYGRSDKLFCSLSCKNSFHNQNRKSDIAYAVDHSLRQNRLILQNLVPAETKRITWSRKVLESLGFKFEAVTGITRGPNGKIRYRLYEFSWDDSSGDDISLQRSPQGTMY